MNLSFFCGGFHNLPSLPLLILSPLFILYYPIQIIPLVSYSSIWYHNPRNKKKRSGREIDMPTTQKIECWMARSQQQEEMMTILRGLNT